MKPLARIPLVDLRGYTPLELLFLYRRQASALAEAAVSSLGRHSAAAARHLLPITDRASRRWLEKSGNPYLTEIRQIAEALPVPGTYTMNICLEWGCTSGVWAGSEGPLLRRVLDWPFPSLGEYAVVAHMSGKLGDFYNVTWPGFSGILQGMAPGRFAAAINQAPMRQHGAGLFGDWLVGRFKVRWNLALPPSHLLRRVFETARDYAAAKTMLSLTPVAVPAIFVLAGTRSGEACVIERTEDSYAIREAGGGRVCAANHFESSLSETGYGWRARPIDSRGRYAKAMTLTRDAQGFSWFTPPIANANSRLAMIANAAASSLLVLGTLGAEPATEVFDLPA
jgi:hypothetical protein